MYTPSQPSYDTELCSADLAVLPKWHWGSNYKRDQILQKAVYAAVVQIVKEVKYTLYLFMHCISQILINKYTYSLLLKEKMHSVLALGSPPFSSPQTEEAIMGKIQFCF